MKNVLRLFIAIFFLFETGCTDSKEVYYLGDLSSGLTPQSNAFEDPEVQVGDQLSIFVSSPDPETAIFFNMSNFSSVQMNQVQQVTAASPILGYLVDINGNIQFPKVGSVAVAGKRMSEIKAMIEEQVKPYVKDAVVNVRCINFRVTVLGEVNKAGTYHVPYHEINLLQALGLAGDLTINGQREKIAVVRTSSKGQETYYVDLTSKDLLQSPVFHLQSGDVIYVRPNKTKINTSSTFFQVWPTVTSAITLLVLVLTNIKP